LTIDDLKALARKYDESIRRSEETWSRRPRDVVAIDRAHVLSANGPNRPEYFLEHARWMCKLMQDFDDIGKLNRWIGFVQCVLLEHCVFTLDELKGHVRQYA